VTWPVLADPQGPVNRHSFTYPAEQLSGDHFEFVVAQRDHRGSIGGERIVEGNFILVQAACVAALAGGIEVFGELDQRFDQLHRGDGAIVRERPSNLLI